MTSQGYTYIAGVGDELPKENFFVRIEGVDDQTHKLVDLSLKIVEERQSTSVTSAKRHQKKKNMCAEQEIEICHINIPGTDRSRARQTFQQTSVTQGKERCWSG